MINPIPRIDRALKLATLIAGKIYHNANAHEFEADCNGIIELLEWSIYAIKNNIDHDPYKKYLENNPTA